MLIESASYTGHLVQDYIICAKCITFNMPDMHLRTIYYVSYILLTHTIEEQ